ncbi:MAG TPA: hypothetical protein VL547_06460 [Dinghuibacter sp.]|jgi:hypothetical protein|uniref:hypothetical protein n=1 Tax=Dinghuibacter sp. TaxID=2024697 RepID=UPI002CA9D70C|nr:hypothetical protein [Dinghuibacter sp.]HTJ11645.1 hypothetical protein [Dinghuibacter sp.]
MTLAAHDMTQTIGTLQFGDVAFDLEKTNLYGILEPHGHMTWWIELFPPGEDDYIMFNALTFDGVFSPNGLSGRSCSGDAIELDLYEHTVRVNGEDRFLDTVDMTFGDWDTVGQCIPIRGRGLVQDEHGSGPIPYAFDALLPFEGLNIFETSREEAHRFLTTHLGRRPVTLKFETAPSGLRAMFSGQF